MQVILQNTFRIANNSVCARLYGLMHETWCITSLTLNSHSSQFLENGNCLINCLSKIARQAL